MIIFFSNFKRKQVDVHEISKTLPVAIFKGTTCGRGVGNKGN
jgi:hypothetical protein